MRDKWYLSKEDVLIGFRFDAIRNELMMGGKARFVPQMREIARLLELPESMGLHTKECQNRVKMFYGSVKEVDMEILRKDGWLLTSTKSFRRLTR